MTLVIDASFVVAALVDGGSDGTWADQRMGDEELVAPHLVLAEVANILRRVELSGALSAEVATLAHADLLALRVGLFPYEPFAARVWELRRNLTAYDAWYVALAESLDATLVTLDQKLASAPGPRCAIETPPSPSEGSSPGADAGVGRP